MKKKLAIVIPAHNEALVIGATLASVLHEVSRRDVYVVDDGSRDETSSVAKKCLGNKNVLRIMNTGKAKAINQGLEHFDLLNKYELIMVHDADTRMVSGFKKEILKVFESDLKKEIACAMGHVLAQSKNWVSAYRIWEYEIGQVIHKQAQSIIGGVTVCPGCSTVYRSKVLKKTNGMSRGTLTEDMDLTFSMHRLGLGKMIYVPRAMMVTQDPQNLKDFYKQIYRWYRGFWQCVFKHNVPWGGGVLDAEIGLMAVESLIQPLLLVATFLLIVVAIREGSYLPVWQPLVIDWGIFMLPSLIWVAYRRRNYGILKWAGHFYLLRMIASLVFMKSFFVVASGMDKNRSQIWNTQRYKVDNFSLPIDLRKKIKLRINT